MCNTLEIEFIFFRSHLVGCGKIDFCSWIESLHKAITFQVIVKLACVSVQISTLQVHLGIKETVCTSNKPNLVTSTHRYTSAICNFFYLFQTDHLIKCIPYIRVSLCLSMIIKK